MLLKQGYFLFLQITMNLHTLQKNLIQAIYLF